MKLEFVESAASAGNITQPRLTIGIPTWNRELLLKEQLQLLSACATEDVEILVCDNGSTDQTWELIMRFQGDTAHRFRALRNGTNLGADVNYLRVLEAATGQWVWMIGDDDRIDFSLLPEILCELANTSTSTLLLLDTHSSDGVGTQHIVIDRYFASDYDQVGMHVLQVGRMVCRSQAIRPFLRDAYAKSLGHLHSYSAIYGPLISREGLKVLVLPILTEHEADLPRWNLMKGFLGAWEASLTMYEGFQEQSNLRETRLRQKPLLWIAIGHFLQRKPLPPSAFKLMYKRFDVKGKIALLSLRLGFGLAPGLANHILRKLKPGMYPQLISSVPDRAPDY
ncbi:hypothetical protein GCM10007242_23740 [Pigmentiphaga litoralis]|uniref:glycosyltransferase family 2 protein n=1 Tax=Pigmentiphaga litoralis TaxID=516702 RepID=UPI001672F421|nr:glycosyltransferase [Pigmentiphaga litoralis]GGX16424.1 hypothetical protein GCM10007242_23740 [Pigmentiphaga litoralis]